MVIIVVMMITEVVMMILLQGGGEGDWSLLLGLTHCSIFTLPAIQLRF